MNGDRREGQIQGLDEVLRARVAKVDPTEPWPEPDLQGWRTFWWEGIGLVARLRPSPGFEEVSVEYEVYQPLGWGQGLDDMLYEGRGNQRETERIDEAATFCFGLIKWDSCSHNYFGEQAGTGTKDGSDGYLHGCSLQNMRRLGSMFERLWAVAHRLLGEHADEGFFG